MTCVGCKAHLLCMNTGIIACKILHNMGNMEHCYGYYKPKWLGSCEWLAIVYSGIIKYHYKILVYVYLQFLLHIFADTPLVFTNKAYTYKLFPK